MPCLSPPAATTITSASIHGTAPAARPTPGSIGLDSYEVILPDADALAAVRERIRGAGLQTRADGDAVLIDDPSGNTVQLLVATSA